MHGRQRPVCLFRPRPLGCRFAPAAGIGAALAVALALRAFLLGGGQIDYDEGVYWQSLRALAAGHELFTAVYSSQPPAFLLLLLPFHAALGGTIAGARLGVLALAGTAGAGRTAWALAGPWAGLLAVALLAADPMFLRESVTLQADGPAVALALVALAAAAESRLRPGRLSLPLAGAAGMLLAMAVLTKLLAVAAAPAVLVVLAAARPDAAAVLRAAGAAALGAGLAAGALLLPFAGAWPDVWGQTVGMHLAARSLPLGGLDGQTALRELPAAAIGAAGYLAAARRAPPLAAAGAAWAVAGAVLLVAQRPLFPHHAVVLAAPLALLGGGLATAVPLRAAAAAAGLAVAVSAASTAYVRSLERPEPAVAPVVAALRAQTDPGDLVVTDDQFTAALADRSTPAQLADTSAVRIQSGALTSGQVEAVAGGRDVRAVLLASGRLSALPGLREWVALHFPDVTDLGDGQTLYVRRTQR